jgi:N-acetylglutamate synthase-like GNAT family acetyltransferase/gas vesicle protein
LAEKISSDEVSFKEMTEEDAVKTFQNDGYMEYQKRSMRYSDNLSPDSTWARKPAKMFVAFYENKPVGVVGFSRHKNVLLGAGIHVRREYRKRGLVDILTDKVISEKGNRTLYVNVTSPKISSTYRAKGFKDMDKESLPADIKEELEGTNYLDQIQKWMKLESPEWIKVLKWRPDETFSSMKGDKIISPNKYSSEYKVLLGGKRRTYESKGNKRLSRWKYYDTTDMIPRWVSKLNDKSDGEFSKKEFWFYAVPNKNDWVFVDATMRKKDGLRNYIFNSIRGLKMGYPSYANFIDIWGTGIKEGHSQDDFQNPFKLKQPKQKRKNKYAEAKNSDEVYQIWKKYFDDIREKINKNMNRIKNATKKETKQKFFDIIDKLKEQVKKEYEIYKRTHGKFFTSEGN